MELLQKFYFTLMLLSIIKKTATLYGIGRYLSKNSSYAASSLFSEPDLDGNKGVIQVRAITGGRADWCVGKPEYTALPRKDENSHFLGIVDKTWDPSIFVNFYDQMVYPEYIIKFR